MQRSADWFSIVLVWMFAGTMVFSLQSEAAAEGSASVESEGLPSPLVLSDGVYSLRSWKVRKDSFDEMLRVHQAYIMPFYERLGVRYLGFWVEIPGPDQPVDAGYDNVYMLTRYDSIEHWQETRAPWAWRESDEDFLRMAMAIAQRRSYAIDEHHQFLSGYEGGHPPRRWRREEAPGFIDSDAFRASCTTDPAIGEPAAYCSCVDERIGPNASPWARPQFLAWLRVGGWQRPELAPVTLSEIDAACAAGNRGNGGENR